MKTLEEVREFFKGDRYATMSNAVIDDFGDKYAKCSMELDDRHRNAVGGIMGGVYFTLADFAMAVATNHEQSGTVSLDAHISFVSACKGDKLIAEARCQRDGRKTCFYEVQICDETGKLIAVVNFTGYKVTA